MDNIKRFSLKADMVEDENGYYYSKEDFKNLKDENDLLKGFIDKAISKMNESDIVKITLEWNECPEWWEYPCYCRSCRSYADI